MKSLPVFLVILALACCLPSLRADDAAARTAAAEELLKTMRLDQLLTREKENILKMSASFAPKTLPEEKRKKVQEAQAGIIDSVLNPGTLEPELVQAYSDVYTEQELKDLTAFYKSPTGQKFLEKMPELQKHTMEIIHKRVMAIMPQLMQNVRDETKPATPKSVATPAASGTGATH